MSDTSPARPLHPPQRRVLELGLLDSGLNCVLQLPTGAGKTWLAEAAISAVLAEGRRAIYLSPLRALASEKWTEWREKYGTQRVGLFTGDFGGGRAYPVSFEESRLMLMTPERLDACTRFWRNHWSWLPEVDLVVIDEFHLLGDPRRGPRLEGCLSRLMRLNPFVRFVGLSATLGNRQELADWLQGVAFYSTWRPVPLTLRWVHFQRAAQKPSLLVEEVARCVAKKGRSLVFVQSRRRAESLAQQLAQQGFRAIHHHAGLKSERRRDVETRFRAGEVDVLVATGTLEMGLNLPASQVILYDLQVFRGDDFAPLPVNSVWQRAGRAGRMGLFDEGEAVLFAPAWEGRREDILAGRFEPILSGLGAPRALAEQILTEVACGLCRNKSQLRRVLGLSLAAHQGRLVHFDQVFDELLKSGMLLQSELLEEEEAEDGVSEAEECEESEEEMSAATRRAFSKGEMSESTRRASSYEEEGELRRLKVSAWGRIAVRQMLAPATLLHFKSLWEGLEQVPSLTFFDLLIISISSGDCEPVLSADFEELPTLQEALRREPSLLLSLEKRRLDGLFGGLGRRFLNVLKTALVAREWTRSGEVEGVVERYHCYPFEVMRLCESLERLLTALSVFLEKHSGRRGGSDFTLSELDWRSLPHRVLPDERAKALLHMVSYGVDEERVTLTLLKGIGGKIARKLAAAGVKDLEGLSRMEVGRIASLPGISSERAEEWIAQAADWGAQMPGELARRYLEGVQGVEVKLTGWPPELDPYRLRRALDLRVQRLSGVGYRVSGGLEPHLVSSQEGQACCDCPDAARGHVCKHVLAVRLALRDPSLIQLLKELRQSEEDPRLDLFGCWFSAKKQAH